MEEEKETQVEEDTTIAFSHAPLTYFAIPKLTPKGPRKNADVGTPHDATRPLTSIIGETTETDAGSWWCAAGGWPSPNPRTTTEVFYVLSGRGRLTDADGMAHDFGPGDVCILPLGWSGRWDIFEDIHKVWVTHDHPPIEQEGVIRIVVVSSDSMEKRNLVPSGVRSDATFGSPSTSFQMFYGSPVAEVGAWACSPGSFEVSEPQDCTIFFHVLDGTFFISNSDGSAQRCESGDTIVLPKGWTGYWDIIDTVRKVWVAVE